MVLWMPESSGDAALFLLLARRPRKRAHFTLLLSIRPYRVPGWLHHVYIMLESHHDILRLVFLSGELDILILAVTLFGRQQWVSVYTLHPCYGPGVTAAGLSFSAAIKSEPPGAE
jgi:hypothetical protein